MSVGGVAFTLAHLVLAWQANIYASMHVHQQSLIHRESTVVQCDSTSRPHPLGLSITLSETSQVFWGLITHVYEVVLDQR